MLLRPEVVDVQLVASATLFYTTLPQVQAQDPAVRVRALLALLDMLALHHSCQQLVKNICLTLRNFDTDRELVRIHRRCICVRDLD